MCIRFLLFAFMLQPISSVFGQCGIQKVYVLEESGEAYYPSRFLEHDGEYYWSLFVHNLEYPITRNRVLRFNADLDMVWSIETKDVAGALSGVFLFSPDDLIIHDSMGYVLANTRDSISLESGVLTNVINLNNGTLDTTFRTDINVGTNDVHVSNYGAVLCSDTSGFVFSATYKLDTNYLLVMKHNFQGQVQWMMTYPITTQGNLGEYKPAIAMPDGGYLFTMSSGFIGDKTDHLLRIDSVGNLLAHQSGPFQEVAVDIDHHPNGNLVYMSQPTPGSSNDIAAMRFTMLTNDLDTIWSRAYSTFEFPYIFAYGAGNGRNLSLAPDGRILMAGETTTTLHLVCYSPNGEHQWSRLLHLLDSEKPGGPISQTFFCEAIWTSDGCILVSGIYKIVSNEFQYRPFLLQLDSMGCLEPGCEETIILNTDQAPETLAENCWQISPNPSVGHVRLWLDRDCTLASVVDQVVVTDMLGREVWRHMFSPGVVSQEIVLPASATGVLYLRIQAGPVILGQKMILRTE